MLSETLPLVRCKKCGIGTMLPLSDYGQDGAAILYKAWICDSPACGYNLRIDRGQVTYGDLPQLKSAQEPAAGRLVARRAQRCQPPAPATPGPAAPPRPVPPLGAVPSPATVAF